MSGKKNKIGIDLSGFSGIRGSSSLYIPMFRRSVNSTLLLGHPVISQKLPHFRWSDRNIDVSYSKMPERVHYSIDNGGGSSDGCGLSDALGAERVMRRGRAGFVRLPIRRLDRRREQVIHEAALKYVAAIVVLNLFVERRTQSHGQTAVNLPFDDHRVDDVPAVVDGHESAHLDLSRSFVDVDYADVAAERIGEVRRVVIRDRFEAGFHSLRVIGVGGERDILNRLCAIGRAFDEELARLPLEVVFVGFEQVSGDLLRLVFDLAGRYGARRARCRSATAGVGAEPIWRGVGVAFFNRHVIDRDPEFFGDDLRIGRFVSLALRFGAESSDGFAGRVDANLGAVEHLQPKDVEVLRRACPDDLREAADADSHQLTALALFGLFLSEL